MENVEWLYDPVNNSWHEQKLHETKKKIHTMSKSQITEQRLAIFEDYIASLAIKNKII